MDFYIDFSYSKLKDVIEMELEDKYSGKKQQGIFIPFEQNYIIKNKKGNIHSMIRATECSHQSRRGSHFLSLIVSEDERKKLRELGFKDNLFVGTMRPTYF